MRIYHNSMCMFQICYSKYELCYERARYKYRIRQRPINNRSVIAANAASDLRSV